MKLFLLSLSAAAFGMSACSQATPDLNKTAMNFGQQGADFGECGLVSQFEKGRASGSQSAGGG